MSNSVLDEHMALVGQTLAKFVRTGLQTHFLSTSNAKAFLEIDVPIDTKTFTDIVSWMLDEGIIRAKEVQWLLNGSFHATAVQLTAKGIAIVKQPQEGGTIQQRVNESSDSSTYGKIGDLVGSALGSFYKSVAGGG